VGAFRLLLALRLRSLWNAARFAPPTHRRIGALLGAGAVLLFGAIFAVFLLLLGATRGAGDDVLRALIDRTVFYLFLFLLAGAVPFVSSTLFAAGDLPLLAAAPVRPGAVVAARLVDAVFASSAQFVVIGVPLLFASAAALRLDPWDWGLFLLLVALFLALPALLTAALLLLLARGIGVRRVRTAVAVASAVLAVAMCLLLVGEFSRQAGRATDGGLAGVLPRMASGGTTPGPPAWLPTAWASEALLALDARDPLAPLLPLSWLLLASALCAVVCVAAGRRVLLGESLLEGDEVSPTSAARADVLDRALALLPLSPPLRAMVGKDLRYLVRDLVLLSQVGIPVILYLVPFVIAGHLGGASSSFAEMFALSAGWSPRSFTWKPASFPFPRSVSKDARSG
jgi:ABC-2 type transport system permease protein